MFRHATYKPPMGLSHGPLWLQPYEALCVCVCVRPVQQCSLAGCSTTQHTIRFFVPWLWAPSSVQFRPWAENKGRPGDLGSLALSPANVGDSQEATILFLAGPRKEGEDLEGCLLPSVRGSVRPEEATGRFLSLSPFLPSSLLFLHGWFLNCLPAAKWGSFLRIM